MTESSERFARLGASYLGDALTEFCVWAPKAHTIALEINGGHPVVMNAEGNGLYRSIASASPGDRYRFVLNSVGLPDPCSRSQPDGVLGSSEVVDARVLRSGVTHWARPRLDELVIYEVHVGTFTKYGRFADVRDHLRALRVLGVRAIELMPVATFPGRRGWGYDGLYTWAPHPAYGKPDDLARLVAAAHEVGLGVILDVVYNHLGPGSEALTAFGPYETSRYSTFWGGALDYAQPAVREWAIQNAEMWMRDYGFDGLRLDAVHAIVDESTPHVLAELAERVRAIDSNIIVISEIETGDLRPINEWNHDAQWGDELHHALHALITGERDGYYAKYGKVSDVASALQRPHHDRFIVFAQNHDQVGNRAFGDRLHGRSLRLAAVCVLVSASVPMLFMGEEYDEPHPFQFFTDHIDPAIAEATRQGRKAEFAAFEPFTQEELPDPQSVQTFCRSKLDPVDGDPLMRSYYRDLLALRITLLDAPILTSVDEANKILRLRRGVLEVVVNFSDREFDGLPAFTARIVR